jgi:hypothetical protein
VQGLFFVSFSFNRHGQVFKFTCDPDEPPFCDEMVIQGLLQLDNYFLVAIQYDPVLQLLHRDTG